MSSENDLFFEIETALELAKNSINHNSSNENTEKWDSLGQLTILSALDELFDGAIADIPEIANSYSVSSILDVLRKNKLI